MKRQKLISKIETIASLDEQTINGMWDLFSRFYDDINYDRFRGDLSKKNYVIICRDPQQKVCGFSTIQLYKAPIAGKTSRVLFSGDTIVSPEYWGYKGLHMGFAKFAFREWLRQPWTPFYWFLISKGYKTYLTLSRNFVDFWPRHDQRTPRAIELAIGQLAEQRFGDAWIPWKGILQFSTPQGRLRDGIVPVTTADLQDPDIAFFVKANPGHANGDELCCLAKFDLWLWLYFVKKTIHQMVGSWMASAPATAKPAEARQKES